MNDEIKDDVQDKVGDAAEDATEKSVTVTTESARTYKNLAHEFFIEYKLLVSVVSLLVFLFTMAYRLLLGQWPLYVSIVWVAAWTLLRYALFIVPPGALLGAVTFKILDEDRRMRVNEMDAAYGGDTDPDHMGYQRKHKVPQGLWEDRIEIDGSAYINAEGQPCVKRLEWDEEEQQIYIWGAWKGESTETEKETWYHAVEETQGRQRYWMQVGKALKFNLPGYLRNIEQSVVERVTRQTMANSTDSLELYESEVAENAEAATESIDSPDGFFSEDFAEEREQDIEQMIDEDTGGAMSQVKGDTDE